MDYERGTAEGQKGIRGWGKGKGKGRGRLERKGIYSLWKPGGSACIRFSMQTLLKDARQHTNTQSITSVPGRCYMTYRKMKISTRVIVEQE
ncbi:hypothetical protein ACN38_g5149 [Penicillium nordicum]|uniref:Uncharacterized protein n=1 Tax=Penicillium nordicum TaxID=229535 RepID=A0A0M8P2S5_9EURO|nr:hypothetical protein ACN38_g5149 [Penicillium nordicum]